MESSPQPHLPKEFIARLLDEPWMKPPKDFESYILESYIYSEHFAAVRAEAVDQGESAINFCVENFDGGFFKGLDCLKDGPFLSMLTQRFSSWSGVGPALSAKERYRHYFILHIAVDRIDPLLACEAIRLGTHIDVKNGRGQTPLLQALERACELHSFLTMVSMAPASAPIPISIIEDTQTVHNAYKRIRYITTVLIDQHANVNATIEWQGKVTSSLHFACAMEDWDLVTALLKHGAERKPTPTCVDAETFLATAAAKHRFAALQADAKGSPRPPRLCPCFSGKPLSDCHSKELPYPDHFTCPCGSKRSFEKCCKKRNLALKELWDEDSQRIVPEPNAAQVSALRQSAFAELTEQVKQAAKQPRGPEWTVNCASLHQQGSELIGREKMGDPAFSFAYTQTAHLPWPQARGRNNEDECRRIQKEWNEAVDRYIAIGVDPRPRAEIEAGAKISISLGPLVRICEADNCLKVEGRNMQKVSMCGRCKMTFYCGATCQKLHWPVHKKMCGKDGQSERPLPSQVVLRMIAEGILQKSSPSV
ncbi:hypothetical protein B0H11DRAFT_2016794 [Mycena galericulata]|nr:hypothetical protein B0H11DRAFT_2016794 [Mycena galericulata]